MALSLLLAPVVAGCASDKQPEQSQTEEVQVVAEDVKDDGLAEKIAKFNDFASQNAFYFGFDSSAIKDDNLVQKYTELMNAMGKDVKYTVSGYCDSRGSVEYNNALGMRRANAVKISLQHKGVDGKMEIKTISYGKNKFQNYYKDFKKMFANL